MILTLALELALALTPIPLIPPTLTPTVGVLRYDCFLTNVITDDGIMYFMYLSLRGLYYDIFDFEALLQSKLKFF